MRDKQVPSALTSQPTFQLLRRALVERVAPLVIISGSGLSVAAGLPDWPGLRRLIQQKLDDLAYANRQNNTTFDSGLHDAAHSATDYWLFFKLARRALTPATFREIIRQSLSSQDLELPRGYAKLLQLAPRGIVTLNLDRLSALAVASAHPGVPIANIHGTELARKWQQINDENPFLVYMHGTVEDSATWVLDSDELKQLMSTQAHSLFLSTLYLQFTVLFVGVSVDDIALSKPLISLNESGFEPPRLFWLTSRNDASSSRWCAENGIQTIRYSASNNDEHLRAITELVEDILEYRSLDPKNPPPLLTNTRQFKGADAVSSDPSDIAMLPPEKAREVLTSLLNTRLASTPQPKLYEEFMKFVEEYDYPIQTRAFYRGKSTDSRKFFGYELSFPPMGIGNFGTVYQATNAAGDAVAVKVMHNNILSSEEMLGGFRRGSSSMRILTESKITGVVSLIESFEMPPTIVMDYVAGNSLSELFDGIERFSWLSKARILREIASIVDSCHKLPNFVLHRDIKPSNIMIEGLDHYDFSYEKLVVLDFDMSWHKGSSEKDVVFESRDDFGYLAPEQTDPTRVGHSRSTKVDSYGLGMTAFALMGATHPIPNMPLDPNWPTIAARAAKAGYKGDWRCLPNRMARFIQHSTMFDQTDRLEFSSGKLRLEKIYQVASGESTIAPLDVAAEELVAIVADGINYKWDDISDHGSVQFAGGAGFEVAVNLERLTLDVKVTYDDVGARNYTNRNALVGECRDYFFELAKVGAVKTHGLTVSSGQFRFVGEISLTPSISEVQKISEKVRKGVSILLKI